MEEKIFTAVKKNEADGIDILTFTGKQIKKSMVLGGSAIKNAIYWRCF
jgi:hypothetical protein